MTRKVLLGKSKLGLTNGGFSSKFSEKIGGKSSLENRAFSGLIGAFSGPIGTNSSAAHSHGKSGNFPKKALFCPIGAFRAKPPFANPRLEFPDFKFQNEKGNEKFKKKRPETSLKILSPVQLPKSFSPALYSFAHPHYQTQYQKPFSQRESAGMAMLTKQAVRAMTVSAPSIVSGSHAAQASQSAPPSSRPETRPPK